MEEIKLDVQIRKQLGRRRVKSIRRSDFVPAVVYGGKRAPTTIQVDRRTYERNMRLHKGQSVVFHLNVMEGEKKLRDYSVLVKEEQFHPVSDKLIHLDFLRISLSEKIEVKVLISAKGEAIGVKKDGGSLDHTLWEMNVVCLPTQIPENIEIDVSALNIGDAIHVKDIVMPEGVITHHDPEGIVFSVVPPMKEESAVSEEKAPEAPEVTKGKKDEAKL